MRSKGAKQRAVKKGGTDHAFGCDLTEHLQATGQNVPQVLRTCAEFIEEHGIVDGIYRLSGVTSNIQRLRQEFVTDSCPDLTKEVYLQDIHCVGSLCKLYFRELPNPLLTYDLYKRFTDAVAVQGESDQLRHIKDTIKELPDAHLRTLEFLSKHLAHLATLSHRTNMHARNLALVWAPNLLRSKDMEQASSCSGDSAFLEVRVQQSVVEFILKHTHQIFGSSPDDKPQPREVPSPMVAEKYATLPVPSSATTCGTLKLMSLEEAQARSLGANHPARQRENSLPDTRTAATLYHTVIDLNDTKRKLSSKSSKRWKSIFGLGRSAKLSRNGSVLVRAQDNEKAAIRPSKSMDSICSLSPDDSMASGNNGSSSLGGGACNGMPMKSRTLGSETDFSLSDENLKVWGFSPKSPRRSISSGATSSSGIGPSATGTTVAPSQKSLPEQLKVFKGDEGSRSFRPTSPKNRRMLFSSSSHHGSTAGPVIGSAPHLSLFPLDSPSLSPRHQRKALNISEPFAVSVPLRVSAVISANSTPCRPAGPSVTSLGQNPSLKPAKIANPSEQASAKSKKTSDPSSFSLPAPNADRHEDSKMLSDSHRKMSNINVAGAGTTILSDESSENEEAACNQEGGSKKDDLTESLNSGKCVLPGLGEILSEEGPTRQSNPSPNPTTPKSKAMGEMAMPDQIHSDANMNHSHEVPNEQNSSLSSTSSGTGEKEVIPLPEQDSANIEISHPTSSESAATSAEVILSGANPKSEQLVECEASSKMQESPPALSTDLGSSEGVPDLESHGNPTVGKGSQQLQGSNLDQTVKEPRGGIQSTTEKDHSRMGWTGDELHGKENLPVKNLSSTQSSKPDLGSNSVEANVPVTSTKEKPATLKKHQEPSTLPEFAPPLLHLSTLRETDILSDFEEIPTINNTGIKGSITDNLEESVLHGNLITVQATCKQETIPEGLGPETKDSTSKQTTRTELTGAKDVEPVAPGKISVDARLTKEEEQQGDVWSLDIEERGQGKKCRGKDRKRKGRGKEKERGLDQVEPWDDMMHTQWVTSPLHTPTIEELFGDVASKSAVTYSQITTSQSPPEAGQLSSYQEKVLESLPKASGASHKNETASYRRNSSPVITTLQPKGKTESIQNPPQKWATKVQAAAAPPQRRFQRQMSHDSTLSSTVRQHPCLPEQRAASRPQSSTVQPVTRNRPCSLDLDRDIDFTFDPHGNLLSYHRIIRDISNQPSPHNNVLDLSIIKGRCSQVDSREIRRINKGGSADLSEELEMFLGNPRAPARRNSAPPPVGVASIRASLTIRTGQAKAVPVIPPKVQYSSMPASTTSDTQTIPDNKDTRSKEDMTCGTSATTSQAVHSLLSSNSKEERENCEPPPRGVSLPTAAPPAPGPPMSPSPVEPPVLRRKHSPNVEPIYPDQMHLPASSLLRQRPSFRNRPRPQSLVLFSPPFPMVDHPGVPNTTSSMTQKASGERPHVRATTGLGRAASFWDKPSKRQEEIRPRWDKSGGQALDVISREKDNCKGSEGDGVVLRGGSGGCNKMTLPKSGQRLETSPTSCFYQPQRRSMVLDSRSSRQIE